MLGGTHAIAMVAVSDLPRARRFYGEVLGLKETGTLGDEVISFRSGAVQVDVYRSEFAGTNKATTLAWDVDDVEAEVAELKSKGVTFEHYDMPGLEREGDVHAGSGMKVAWFKDPDGNILSVMSG